MRKLTAYLFVCLCVAAGASAEPLRTFLFSTANPADLPQGCTRDPRGLMALPQIQSAIHELGLEGSDIRLQGCAVAQFSVQTLAISATLPTYRVYYPDVPAFETSDYLPPLVHELAHILQINQAGSLEALKAEFTSEQIELGADFLAGLIAGRHRIFDPVDFHANLNVVGHYRQSSNEHGSPERRTASFQFGVYHDENSSIGGVADAYAYFQDVLYADLPRGARARNRN